MTYIQYFWVNFVDFFTQGSNWKALRKLKEVMKKEFTGPGLHLRPVHADHARPPLQWTLNSVLSPYGNDNRRIRPPLDRGTLKTASKLLLA